MRLYPALCSALTSQYSKYVAPTYVFSHRMEWICAAANAEIIEVPTEDIYLRVWSNKETWPQMSADGSALSYALQNKALPTVSHYVPSCATGGQITTSPEYEDFWREMNKHFKRPEDDDIIPEEDA